MIRGVGVILVFALGILLGPVAAQAPQTAKLYRIGFLGNSTAAEDRRPAELGGMSDVLKRESR